MRRRTQGAPALPYRLPWRARGPTGLRRYGGDCRLPLRHSGGHRLPLRYYSGGHAVIKDRVIAAVGEARSWLRRHSCTAPSSLSIGMHLARGERRNGGRHGESCCCRLAWASIHVSMGRAGRKLGVAAGAGRKGGPAPGGRCGERGERRRPARRQDGGRNEKTPLDCGLILLKFKGFF